ncbi:MAG: hypothetical protein R3E96_01935 [Planctomycetota bacterium]
MCSKHWCLTAARSAVRAQGLGTQEELLLAVRYGLKAVLLLENHWPELEVLG